MATTKRTAIVLLLITAIRKDDLTSSLVVTRRPERDYALFVLSSLYPGLYIE
jgi:hypothetical protein